VLRRKRNNRFDLYCFVNPIQVNNVIKKKKQRKSKYLKEEIDLYRFFEEDLVNVIMKSRIFLLLYINKICYSIGIVYSNSISLLISI